MRLSKRCILALGAIVLAGVIVGHYFVPVALTRRFELALVAIGTGGACVVEWASDDPAHPPNGFYIDLDAAERTDSVAKVALSRPLPAYAAGPLRVTLPASHDGRVIIEDARVVTRLLGGTVRVEPFEPPLEQLDEGSHADATVAFPLEPLPALSCWLIRLGMPAVLGMLVALLVVALRLGAHWNAFRTRFLPSIRADSSSALDRRLFSSNSGYSRWLTLGAVSTAIIIPFYLAAWAPMILYSDSTAYIWLGKLLYENRDPGHLDGWRLPGYALFIAPWVAHAHNYTLYIGLAQATLGVITSLLVFDIVRRRLPAPWAHVAMLLTALDPFLLVWQRTVLSETLASFLAVACAWVFARASEPCSSDMGSDSCASRAGTMPARLRALFPIGALGVICGIASLVRGNLQFLAIIFACAFVVRGVATERIARGVVGAGVLLAAFGLTISPVVAYNARVFGVPSLVVGAPAGRTVFAWLNTDIDFNQSASFSFEQYRDLQRRVDRLEVNEWQFTGELERNERIPVPPKTHPWVARSIRSDVVLRESIARDPRRYANRLLQATVAHLGFPVRGPWYMNNLTRSMVGILRGQPVAEKSNFYDDLSRFPESIRSVFERVIVDCTHVPSSRHAMVLGLWWRLWEFARPALSVLGGLACLTALARRDIHAVAFGAVYFGNIAAVVLVQFAGETRYSMPLDPFLFLTLLLGLLGRPPPSTPRAAMSPPFVSCASKTP